MLILGIETSCDETSASLIESDDDKIKVLSNIVSSQIKLHAKFGGVVPSLAAREHVKNIGKVLTLAIKGNSIEDIDLIAVTRGPGLVSSLLVGTTFAKTLAWKFKKPIIGVNHIKGHIASNFLPKIGEITSAGWRTKKNPTLCLTVSGGHTELILIKSASWRTGRYQKIGQTLDDAAGEAFDKIARILELGYPGGPAISVEAEKLKIQSTNWRTKFEIKLPRPMLNSKNFDFSFSGLKTAVLYLVRDLKKELGKEKLPKEIITQIAVEAQQAIVDTLVTKAISAAKKYKAKTILLAGGVSANKLLRSQLKELAEKNGFDFSCPLMEYTTDNAAMIALAGYLENSIRQPADKNRKLNWQGIRADANLSI